MPQPRRSTRKRKAVQYNIDDHCDGDDKDDRSPPPSPQPSSPSSPRSESYTETNEKNEQEPSSIKITKAQKYTASTTSSASKTTLNRKSDANTTTEKRGWRPREKNDTNTEDVDDDDDDEEFKMEENEMDEDDNEDEGIEDNAHDEEEEGRVGKSHNDNDDKNDKVEHDKKQQEKESSELKSTQRRKRVSQGTNKRKRSGTATATERRKKNPVKRTRKSNTGSAITGSNIGTIVEDGGDLICPYCQKEFSTPNGLSYHLDRKVCVGEKSTKSRGKKLKPGTYPYPKLTPKSQFITPYGIVQVISDARMPDDHNRTCLPKDIKDKNRTYCRKRERIQKRKINLTLYHAKKQRKRRMDLINIYQKMKSASNSTSRSTLSENERAQEFSSQIWKLYSTLTTPSLILSGKYSQNLDRKMHDQVQTVEKHPWNELGQDPMEPLDCYPDRIVECVLIKDERTIVYETDLGTESEGRLSRNDAVKKSLERAKKDIALKKEKEDDDDSNGRGRKQSQLGILNAHPSGLRLFLRRRLLVHSYDRDTPIYQCSKSRKTFLTRLALKTYVEMSNEESTKQEEIQKKITERNSRLKEIEDAVTTNQIKSPQALTVTKSAVTSGSGSKSKRKKHKKWPAWLEFYPDLSVIYPEVFNTLKFRRGSNNSKFMQKKLDAIGPGRKKVRKSRAKVNREVQEWIKNRSFKPVYPEVMMHFFPEFESVPTPKKPVAKYIKVVKNENNIKVPLASIERNVDEGMLEVKQGDQNVVDYNATMPINMTPLAPAIEVGLKPDRTLSPPQSVLGLVDPSPQPKSIQTSKPQETKKDGDKLQDKKSLLNCTTTSSVSMTKKRSIDEKKDDTTPKARRKRKRGSVAPPKKDICPMVVDIRPLIEEIRAGRYPSIKEYSGDHPDICFACKNKGDDLRFCEFCENAEHLSCVQSKIAILEPEADDEFMCHRCIQTIVARRARAERRRQQKLDEAIGKSSSTSNEPSSTALTLEEARAATSVREEIVWNQAEFDSHVATFKKCPSGGPGGLICCSFCTSAYSRLLSETSKEMDAQTVSSVGREVSELIQLLHDAQMRLQQSIDVSNANDQRMSLLNKDQMSFAHIKNTNVVGTKMNIIGFMDMFSSK